MGRPRRSRNTAPKKVTAARVERWRRGLSLHTVSNLTGIPPGSLSAIERGEMQPTAADLTVLAGLFDYGDDPSALMREVMSEKERHA